MALTVRVEVDEVCGFLRLVKPGQGAAVSAAAAPVPTPQSTTTERAAARHHAEGRSHGTGGLLLSELLTWKQEISGGRSRTS